MGSVSVVSSEVGGVELNYLQITDLMQTGRGDTKFS